MDLAMAKQLLSTCVKSEFQNPTFDDAEVAWYDGEMYPAIGYFSKTTKEVSVDGLGKFTDEAADELRKCFASEQVTQSSVLNAEKLVVSDRKETHTYTRVFDDSSHIWEPNVEINRMILRSQEHYLNDRLQAFGHLFLNEVYDALGLPRSKEGATMGWGVWSDERISFNVVETDVPNKFKLTFNVEVIYDRLLSEEDDHEELTGE